MASLIKIIKIQLAFAHKMKTSPCFLPEYEELQGRKKCFVFLAADYGNLGDVAITYAQEKYLSETFPGYKIVDVPISKTLSSIKAIQSIISKDDIITTAGGGNMCDLYFDIELLRQLVVKAFPDNKVISFPQTIFFSNTLSGIYIKYLAKKTYNKHPNITIVAREKLSFEIMCSLFQRCNIKLTPDIVMSLDKRRPTVKRLGVTLCLRNDAERAISDSKYENLLNKLSKKFKISNYDTHIGKDGLSIIERKSELEKIWDKFRTSEWVITDRLHGMIFAFITGTPAIVFSNNNHKIEGAYEWIKDCGYIYFIKNGELDDVMSIISRHMNFDATGQVFKRVQDSISKIN